MSLVLVLQVLKYSVRMYWWFLKALADVHVSPIVVYNLYMHIKVNTAHIIHEYTYEFKPTWYVFTWWVTPFFTGEYVYSVRCSILEAVNHRSMTFFGLVCLIDKGNFGGHTSWLSEDHLNNQGDSSMRHGAGKFIQVQEGHTCTRICDLNLQLFQLIGLSYYAHTAQCLSLCPSYFVIWTMIILITDLLANNKLLYPTGTQIIGLRNSKLTDNH